MKKEHFFLFVSVFDFEYCQYISYVVEHKAGPMSWTCRPQLLSISALFGCRITHLYGSDALLSSGLCGSSANCEMGFEMDLMNRLMLDDGNIPNRAQHLYSPRPTDHPGLEPPWRGIRLWSGSDPAVIWLWPSSDPALIWQWSDSDPAVIWLIWLWSGSDLALIWRGLN